MLNGRGETVETKRITASFPFFFPSVAFSLVTSSLTDVRISGWADGNFGTEVVENFNLRGALVGFRDTGMDRMVVCGREI